MNTTIIGLALIAPSVILAAYLIGRHHGSVRALDDLWGPAMAMGAYGQQVRSEAASAGMTVAEFTGTCLPESTQSGARICSLHWEEWPCPGFTR